MGPLTNITQESTSNFVISDRKLYKLANKMMTFSGLEKSEYVFKQIEIDTHNGEQVWI